MDRLREFKRGLRKTTAVTKVPVDTALRIPELLSPEPTDNGSLHRPSTHVSRTTAGSVADTFHTATRHVTRHSTIPSISSIGPDPSSPTAIDSLTGYTRRLSLDPALRKLMNYLYGCDSALALAIAYLGATNKQCDGYLKLHQTKAEANRRRDIRLSSTTNPATNLLAVSVEITLDEIEARHHQAFQLLEVLAFFDNKNICYEVFHAARSAPPPVIREAVSSRIAFDRTLLQLQSFGIVEGTHFYYHVQPQVHGWVLRNCLRSSPTQSLSFSKYAARCVVDAFESTNRSFTWYQCLVCHAEHLTLLKIFDFWLTNSLDEDTFPCIEGLARVLTGFGRDQRVEQMFQKILGYQQKHLGYNHPATCKTMWRLGRQHAEKKEYLQADALLNNALAGFEQILGYEEYVTWCLIDLAKAYRYQRIFIEAEKMLRLARHGLFNFREQCRDPKQVFEMNIELAKLFREQGKLDEAERALKQAGSYAENNLGGSTRCKVELGGLYVEQGKIHYAQTCLEQALLDHQRSSGLDEQDLTTLVGNLSFIYSANGNPNQAMQLHRRFDSNLNLIHVPGRTSTIHTSGNIHGLPTQSDHHNRCTQRTQYGYVEMPP